MSAGTNWLNQASAWKPFTTVSLTIGTSSRLALRFGALTASARSLLRHHPHHPPRGLALFDIRDYAGQGLTTGFRYDGLDRLVALTQPEGGSTTYSYSSTNAWAHNMASATKVPKPGAAPPPSLVTSYTYEPTFNKPLTVTDPRGLVTTMTYDGSTGNLLKMVADAGSSPHFNATTSFTYDNVGLPLTVRDPTGTFTRFAYDGFGNRTTATGDAGGLNRTTSYAYDTVGNIVSVTDPRGNATTATWDAKRQRLTSTTPGTRSAPRGLTTTSTYDANGQVVQLRQSADGGVLRTTSATYTPTGKPATTTDARGNVTRYGYDLLDRQVSVTDPMSRVTQFTYTVLGQPYRAYNSDIQPGPLLEQGWTADGLPASLKDANGNTTTFAYDRFDRPVTTTYPGGSTETATYDANGNPLTRKTRAGATLRYGYDTLNRLATKTAAAAPVACGAAPSATPTATYSYDLAGRLTGVCDNSASIAAIAPTSTVYRTAYSYDALDQPDGVSFDPVPAPTLPATGSSATFSFTYNPANQRTSFASTDNAWIDYATGPPSTTAYTANNLNQYTAVGGVTPTYDGNGNLTSDGTFTLGYDAENRLVSASKAGMSATYAFDAQGRRKRKSVTTGSTAATVFVTDADNREVLEYDGSTGAIQRWYAYGLGPNDVLAQSEVGAGTRATPIPDLLGSIIGMMNASGGSITRYGYKPYGDSSSAPGQFGFTGQRIDAESALYYYRARHYSPVWGRFLQVDPMGYSDSTNLYGYAANDPLNLFDPTGLGSEGPKMSTLASLGSTMIRPYVDFYQRSVVQPFSAAARWVASTPAGDVALWQSMQGLGPPGALISGTGQTVAMGLRYMASISEFAATGAFLRAAESAAPLAQVTQNRIAGNAFRDSLADSLRAAGRDVGTEVYKSTPFGKRFIDIEVSKDGQLLGGIETKMGSSPYTSLQQLKDWWLKDALGYTVNVARDR